MIGANKRTVGVLALLVMLLTGAALIAPGALAEEDDDTVSIVLDDEDIDDLEDIEAGDIASFVADVDEDEVDSNADSTEFAWTVEYDTWDDESEELVRESETFEGQELSEFEFEIESDYELHIEVEYEDEDGNVQTAEDNLAIGLTLVDIVLDDDDIDDLDDIKVNDTVLFDSETSDVIRDDHDATTFSWIVEHDEETEEFTGHTLEYEFDEEHEYEVELEVEYEDSEGTLHGVLDRLTVDLSPGTITLIDDSGYINPAVVIGLLVVIVGVAAAYANRD